MLCNIGSARSTTYAAQMVCRVLGSILISPPFGMGSGVITELCEPEHRAQKLGWWTLLLTLGTPCGPFIMGFVTQHAGVQWIFWIFTIVNFVQLVLYVAIGDETLYIPGQASSARKGFFSKFIPRRINPRPLRLREFIEPVFLSRHIRVLVPAIAHCIVFCYANIVLIVEMPIAFGEKFNFNAQQIGLQFIAIIIGCVLGEQLSGPMSDWFLMTLKRRKGYFHTADRLWLSYIGYATVVAGLLVWGFQLEKADGTWNVTPCVGAAIASFGNQIITTILISFAVDSYKEQSTDVGVCINLYRQIYGFVSDYYGFYRLLLIYRLDWPVLLSHHVRDSEAVWCCRRDVRCCCCCCFGSHSRNTICCLEGEEDWTLNCAVLPCIISPNLKFSGLFL